MCVHSSSQLSVKLWEASAPTHSNWTSFGGGMGVMTLAGVSVSGRHACMPEWCSVQCSDTVL